MSVKNNMETEKEPHLVAQMQIAEWVKEKTIWL